MNLVSQLLFAVIISSATSTLLLFAWRILRRCFMAANPKLVNVTLRMICVTYLLPIGYVVILLSKHRWLKGWGSTWKLYFARTRHITWLIRIAAVVWFAIAAARILMCILQNKVWCRKLEDNIPIEEEMEAEVFCEVCQRLDIPEGKVSLQRNPLMKSPMIVRVFNPQVLLPEQDYTEKELELIFYHELSHYKHRDLKWKVVVIMITMLQAFNPLVYPLISIVSLWDECMADVSALEASGNLHCAKQYFAIIESLMPESTGEKKDKYLFASLYRSNETMVRRVEFVQHYQHAHICSGRAAAVMLSAFLFVSMAFAAEVGIGIADLHKFVYQLTENDSEIQIASDGMTELYIDGGGWVQDQSLDSVPSEKSQRVEGETLYCLDLEAGPDVCRTTDNFQVKEGQSIDVSTGVRSWGVDYWVGILDEEGHVCYVKGDGSVSHTFRIEKAGWYRVFIKNNSMDTAISYVSVRVKLMNCRQKLEQVFANPQANISSDN